MKLDLVTQIRAAGLPEPSPEWQFCKTRRWRFDWAWAACKLALEIEGGVWKGGRHVRPRGYINDLAKYSEAAILGWVVLRVTPEQVTSGEALSLVERALKNRVDDPQAWVGWRKTEKGWTPTCTGVNPEVVFDILADEPLLAAVLPRNLVPPAAPAGKE